MFLDNLLLPKTGTCFNIRQLKEPDFDDFYTLSSDANLKQFMGGAVTLPRKQWIAGMKKNQFYSEYLAIKMKPDSCFAGFASFNHFLKGPEISNTFFEFQILIAKLYQKQGLGTEISNILIAAAFHELKAERIYAVVDPQNQSSIKMFSKLGFKPEGEVNRIEEWQHGHKIFALASKTHRVAS
ncbi:GNAT family N-acetyltransferase [Candidatus Nitrotoga sp. AM1P]|uniref:GNAT family N-acetyltransferase n=1 Tax=Candidatus Nitrotoga sp. AM1P TaxID=2559597 RepID=UPI0010B1F67C|nr:GNAT family N-acetyltransferase [Candidatus Nitrotoga sp. AM1P]BBJ23485.1 hypothetical protein W01_14120 [Candidatus Nitrotoga sp. AM1P]